MEAAAFPGGWGRPPGHRPGGNIPAAGRTATASVAEIRGRCIGGRNAAAPRIGKVGHRVVARSSDRVVTVRV